LKQGEALFPFLFNFALEMLIQKAPLLIPGGIEIEWDISACGVCC
jgi:hypothetical protein